MIILNITDKDTSYLHLSAEDGTVREHIPLPKGASPPYFFWVVVIDGINVNNHFGFTYLTLYGLIYRLLPHVDINPSLSGLPSLSHLSRLSGVC
jgi:hypothetical protein